MRRLLLGYLFLGLCVSFGVFSSTSKTILAPRMLSMDDTYDISMDEYFRQMDGYFYFNLNVTPFYSRSTNTGEMAKYFLLNNQEDVSVSGVDGVGVTHQDGIYSEWIGIASAPDAYLGSFSISPRRTIYGAVFKPYFSYEKFWLGMVIPLVNANHDLNFSESSTGEAPLPGSVQTILEGFNQGKYARFYSGSKSQLGVDDIKIKLGGRVVNCSKTKWNLYAQGLFPTGKKDQSEYLFNPRVGSRHYGAGIGTNLYQEIWREKEYQILFLTDFNWFYRFSATERRAFDLTPNGQYSRYLLVAPNGSATNPYDGANYMGGDFRVEPKNSFEGLLGFHFKMKKIHLELTYDFFYRQKESVLLEENWPKEDIGIFNPGAILDTDPTSSASTIGTSFTQAANIADASFISLNKNNIDESSATQESLICHKFLGGLAGEFCVGPVLGVLGINVTYEFAHKNDGLSQWGISTNFGIKY